MKNWIYISFFFTICFVLTFFCQAQKVQFKRQEWRKEKIAPGLIHKHLCTKKLFNSNQNIHLLMIHNRKRRIKIAASEEKLIKTSEMASANGALAAVNGGFFNMLAGGAVNYLKAQGKTMKYHLAKNNNNENQLKNAAFLISKKGQVSIEKAREDSVYAANTQLSEVLVCGPLLILAQKQQTLIKNPFNDNRHPRTCAGLKNKRKLILLTVDGRTPEALGMSLEELTNLLLHLKVKFALNLDGGGSTTMWIKGKPDNGVVNMPCDNKKFDHLGERPCANAILIY